MTLALDGGTARRFRRDVTSETQNAEQVGDVTGLGDAVTVTVGPQSVTTLVSDVAPVAVDAGPDRLLSLAQNRPNPVGAGPTPLTYTLPTASPVALAVFDVLGQQVATLVDEIQAAGDHEVVFDGSSLASGIYVYRLTASGQTAQRRMAIAR